VDDSRRHPRHSADLRPIGPARRRTFATSDLNDLYRRVINRNNRLKRLLDLGAPEIIVNNEKRMLQEAVDALFDNGRRAVPNGPGNRPLKSISDMLKGKQGRFRQNLLGKRVDYSGRSSSWSARSSSFTSAPAEEDGARAVQAVVMKRLVDARSRQNIKSASAWSIVAATWSGRPRKSHPRSPVMLNRAPTLHASVIQAFEPILVEGKPSESTARLHRLQRGLRRDQMAVHLPLLLSAGRGSHAHASTNNVSRRRNGRPLTTPTQDMVIGLYYLTADRRACSARACLHSAWMTRCSLTTPEATSTPGEDHHRLTEDNEEQYFDLDAGKNVTGTARWGTALDTTVGRITFNRSLRRPCLHQPRGGQEGRRGASSRLARRTTSTQPDGPDLDDSSDLASTMPPAPASLSRSTMLSSRRRSRRFSKRPTAIRQDREPV